MLLVIALGERSSGLEHGHAQAGLGEALGGPAAGGAGAHDDDVEVLACGIGLHGCYPELPKYSGWPSVHCRLGRSLPCPDDDRFTLELKLDAYTDADTDAHVDVERHHCGPSRRPSSFAKATVDKSGRTDTYSCPSVCVQAGKLSKNTLPVKPNSFMPASDE